MPEEEKVVKVDKFFSKQMVIPVALFVITAVLSAKTVIDKLEVRMSSVENSLAAYAATHITKPEFDAFKYETQRRDARLEMELDRAQTDLKDINKYLRDDWGWKKNGSKR